MSIATVTIAHGRWSANPGFRACCSRKRASSSCFAFRDKGAGSGTGTVSRRAQWRDRCRPTWQGFPSLAAQSRTAGERSLPTPIAENGAAKHKGAHVRPLREEGERQRHTRSHASVQKGGFCSRHRQEGLNLSCRRRAHGSTANLKWARSRLHRENLRRPLALIPRGAGVDGRSTFEPSDARRCSSDKRGILKLSSRHRSWHLTVWTWFSRMCSRLTIKWTPTLKYADQISASWARCWISRKCISRLDVYSGTTVSLRLQGGCSVPGDRHDNTIMNSQLNCIEPKPPGCPRSRSAGCGLK